MVTAPTGDPEYFFTTHCLDGSAVNNGHYHSDRLEELEAELAVTFDTARRSELAVEMQQTILDVQRASAGGVDGGISHRGGQSSGPTRPPLPSSMAAAMVMVLKVEPGS